MSALPGLYINVFQYTTKSTTKTYNNNLQQLREEKKNNNKTPTKLDRIINERLRTHKHEIVYSRYAQLGKI